MPFSWRRLTLIIYKVMDKQLHLLLMGCNHPSMRFIQSAVEIGASIGNYDRPFRYWLILLHVLSQSVFTPCLSIEERSAIIYSLVWWSISWKYCYDRTVGKFTPVVCWTTSGSFVFNMLTRKFITVRCAIHYVNSLWRVDAIWPQKSVSNWLSNYSSGMLQF